MGIFQQPPGEAPPEIEQFGMIAKTIIKQTIYFWIILVVHFILLFSWWMGRNQVPPPHVLGCLNSIQELVKYVISLVQNLLQM